jgi:hypothetical protein
LRPAKGLKAGSVKFFKIVDGLPAFFLCVKIGKYSSGGDKSLDFVGISG